MKNIRKYLAIVSVVLCCACNGTTEQREEPFAGQASEVANAATEDLGLSSGQSKSLETAIYRLYIATDEKSKGINSESRLAEISSETNKEFQKELDKVFAKDKAAEILAWYYNYNNRKK